jgi:DNA primase
VSLGRIPEETIREIRDRADIIGLIGRYVELKKAGRNFKGLCPFHGEKTPSFNVNPDKQIFHCFGCGEGGDVISFLMRYEGLTFPEAARNIARDCGIEIPETSSGDEGISQQIFSANEIAQDVYVESLQHAEAGPAGEAPTAADAVRYLVDRGIDAAAIERFGIGFAPNRWDAVERALTRKGVPGKLGEQAGILAPRKGGQGHYDRLRGRVTFPIQDVRGRLIGFGGRALAADQEPKYLNTPESPVFHKRQALYGFPLALEGIRRAGRAIICEGYFDRIALDRAGLTEGLATCGTALTADHGHQLRRRTQEVVLLFDGDAAGQKAVERALEVLLPEGLRVRAATLPDGEDPDTYLLRHGVDALRTIVDKAPDALETVIRQTLAKGWRSPGEKADAVSALAPLIALIPNRIERDEYSRRLAVAIDSESASVQAAVRAEATGRGGTAGDSSVSAEIGRTALPRESRDDRHQRDFAVLLYRHPSLVKRYSREQLERDLPEGQWKVVVGNVVAAWQEGLVDAGGAIDLFALEAKMGDGEGQRLIREMAVHETLTADDMSVEEVFASLIVRLAKRRIDAEMKELTRRMREPDADTDALLREKQRLTGELRSLRTAS